MLPHGCDLREQPGSPDVPIGPVSGPRRQSAGAVLLFGEPSSRMLDRALAVRMIDADGC
jgi:hypothetical protein